MLSYFVNSEPVRTGKIIISLAQNEILFNFFEDKVKGIVQIMYNDEESKSVANEICEIYARKGYFYLNELYSTNNQGVS